MGIRAKTLITVLLVGSIVGILVLNIQNENLFQGQVFDGPDEDDQPSQTLLPDLSADLEVVATSGQDLSVTATIENIGQGAVPGGSPFRYAVFINDTEVFSNSDSYSSLSPDDSFSFTYPIPREIYQYEDTGTVTFTVDTENAIEESNEQNNSSQQTYSY